MGRTANARMAHACVPSAEPTVRSYWRTDVAEGVAAHMVWTDDWSIKAACRSSDPDALFVQGAAQNRAKTICMGCAVRTECLADALDNRIEFGVWGGMTERERRALLRRRPQITSWRGLLDQARTRYETLSESDVEAVAEVHLPASVRAS